MPLGCLPFAKTDDHRPTTAHVSGTFFVEFTTVIA